ncbi:MAG: HypC/HybG/HupF family hydrogenase formation chaperone [Pseudomonadota bacterium]
MCVGVPMRIVEADGLEAICVPYADAAGAHERVTANERVTLALIGPAAAGEHVLVYLGSAVRRLEPREAADIAGALQAVRNAAAGEPFEHLIADLIDREPELPAHLREIKDDAAEAGVEDRLKEDAHGREHS